MSDHNERACTNCGSYLHHEDNCPRTAKGTKVMERIKSPDCINGETDHEVGDGEVGDNEGMLFVSCSRCFERFYLISETVMKESGLLLVPKAEGGG